MTQDNHDQPRREALNGLAARARLAPLQDRLRQLKANPDRLMPLLRIGLPVLVILGLLLPPVSLVGRLRSIGFAKLEPGVDARVETEMPGAFLDVRKRAILRPARLEIGTRESRPRDAARLPSGAAGAEPITLSPYFVFDLRGPAPREGWLSVVLDIEEGDQPFVDPMAWDGERWHWLPLSFDTINRARVQIPFEQFVPQYLVITEAPDAATQVSASLFPPPAAVPAAVAQLPVLEMRAYHLSSDDGRITGRRFRVPSRNALLYGIVDNLEGSRERTDLVDNFLLQRESRLLQREALVNIVRRDGLDGIILDYRGIAADLNAIYADWLGRLNEDLDAVGAELFVALPMPRRSNEGWDGGALDWRTLGRNVDGLRIRLPNDAPLEIDTLDDMLRWALQSVERRKLQLSVPVRGRDIVEQQSQPIGYNEALGRILDMAQSDLPDRITPGSSATVELPTVRAAELGRDPATGMWRFYYWDGNRRQHTVWLNDAEGLQPAFEIARRYRMSRLALDGVEAGLDPALWEMVTRFIETGVATSEEISYELRWTLMNEEGQLIQESVQTLEEPSFEFRAPADEGAYNLAVNLVASGSRVMAMGQASALRIAPPPPASPTPTPNIIIIEPTPITYQTAPAPADESTISRAPIEANISARQVITDSADAIVRFASAQLRDGPDAREHSVISDLKVGDGLSVVGKSPNSQWLKVVVLGTGIEGWVLAALVTLEIDPEGIPYYADQLEGIAPPGVVIVTVTPSSGSGSGAGAGRPTTSP
jgi:hypothetical protein